MDPNATLDELLELKDEIHKDQDAAAEEADSGEPPYHQVTDREIRMAELVEALDGWLSTGGFLPRKWRR